MAGAAIQVDARGIAPLAGALNRLAAGAVDTLPLMEEIGAYVETSVAYRFEHGVKPGGWPWPPSWRELLEGGQTMVKSGRLRDSITSRATADSVEIGTNVKYAATHQFGATIKAKTSKGLRFRVGDGWVTKRQVTIPKRPFLGLDASDEREIGEILNDYLMEAVQ